MKSCNRHQFSSAEEVQTLRANLLGWFDENKRTLPWRSIASDQNDPDVRGYSIWVSEVMLQQTQVATVIDYYKKWMAKWPDLKSLSQSSLEEVHKVWAGLGYYSRATRLREGALMIEEKLGGKFPQKSEAMKDIPGVGRYTASAIASIAFKEVVGVVDGNVVRVLSRMRCIGAESTSKRVVDTLWNLTNNLVDPERPGDFNQSLMELGAVICTPKSPNCSTCPVSEQCSAYKKVQNLKDESRSKFIIRNKSKQVEDIEEICTDCDLCFDPGAKYESEDGVLNYPRKGKKTKVRDETSLVFLVQVQSRYLVMQRPKTGLLASLLEFPSFPLLADEGPMMDVKRSEADKILRNRLTTDEVKFTNLKPLGKIFHQFSHIKQTYVVWAVTADEEFNVEMDPVKYQEQRWIKSEEIPTSAISTAMKKVFKLVENTSGLKRKSSGKPLKETPRSKNQKSISSFFSSK